MPGEISRQFYDGAAFTATNGATTSPRQAFGNAAAAIMFVTAGNATQVNWHVDRESDDVPLPAYDSTGVAITQAVTTGRAYEVPASLFAARYIVPVTSSGTASIILSSKG